MVVGEQLLKKPMRNMPQLVLLMLVAFVVILIFVNKPKKTTTAPAVKPSTAEVVDQSNTNVRVTGKTVIEQ